MEKIIDYIEKELNNFSNLGIQEKIRFIIKGSYILKKNEERKDLIKQLLSKIEILRYEMAFNKGYEAVASFGIDYSLVYIALELSKLVYEGKDIEKFVNDVLYYENNEDFREYIKEISL